MAGEGSGWRGRGIICAETRDARRVGRQGGVPAICSAGVCVHWPLSGDRDRAIVEVATQRRWGVPGGYYLRGLPRAVTDHGEASSGDAACSSRSSGYSGCSSYVPAGCPQPERERSACRPRLTGALRRSRSGASCQRSPCALMPQVDALPFHLDCPSRCGPVLISVIHRCGLRGSRACIRQLAAAHGGFRALRGRATCAR